MTFVMYLVTEHSRDESRAEMGNTVGLVDARF